MKLLFDFIIMGKNISLFTYLMTIVLCISSANVKPRQNLLAVYQFGTCPGYVDITLFKPIACDMLEEIRCILDDN